MKDHHKYGCLDSLVFNPILNTMKRREFLNKTGPIDSNFAFSQFCSFEFFSGLIHYF